MNQDTHGQEVIPNCAWQMQLSGVGFSHIGKTRYTNQDRYYTNNTSQVFVVADGVGGLRFGERASDIAINSLKVTLRENPLIPMNTLLDIVNQAVKIAGIQLTGNACGIGTTITCVRNVGECCEVGHVGDSKLYWLSSGEVCELSADHSVHYQPKVARILSDGIQAISKPRERTYLDRYLGQRGVLRPQVACFRPNADDLLLLCSDGISGAIGIKEIVAIVNASESKIAAIKAFIASAESRGGSDNQTAVLVSCNTMGATLESR